MSEEERIRVAPRLTLFTPDDLPLPVRDVYLTSTWDGPQMIEAVLQFTVAPEEWGEIDRGGWFHLCPDVRGPTFAGGFEPDQDVEIEARLGEPGTMIMAMLSEDPYDAGALLVRAEPGNELVRTETWYALYVKQERGPVKVGFQTKWVE